MYFSACRHWAEGSLKALYCSIGDSQNWTKQSKTVLLGNRNFFSKLFFEKKRMETLWALFLASLFSFFQFIKKGTARTLVPTTKNYALEPPRFGVVAGVSPCGVQCTGLVLEAPPSWSRYPPRQVSMKLSAAFAIQYDWKLCNSLLVTPFTLKSGKQRFIPTAIESHLCFWLAFNRFAQR